TTDTLVLVTDSSIISQHNRGPITTLFVPPASCVQTLTLAYPNGDYGMQYGYGGRSYIDLACYPSASSLAKELGTSVDLTSYFTGTSADWASYYYSPAICPYGYYTAKTFSTTIDDPYDPPGSNVIAIGSETTAALCCPSGYDYQAFNHWCSSTITANQIIAYISPRVDGPKGWVPGPVSFSTYPAASYVWGNGVPVWYQGSDAAVLTAIPTMTPPSKSSTPRPTVSSTIPPTMTPIASIPSKPSLSTGTKVGMGVGIPLVTCAAIAIIFFFFRSRRRRHV
ncbi:uncharacterized protein BDZ99DRAFT_370450, partial [Mytilinidion resinicola]